MKNHKLVVHAHEAKTNVIDVLKLKSLNQSFKTTSLSHMAQHKRCNYILITNSDIDKHLTKHKEACTEQMWQMWKHFDDKIWLQKSQAWGTCTQSTNKCYKCAKTLKPQSKFESQKFVVHGKTQKKCYSTFITNSDS